MPGLENRTAAIFEKAAAVQLTRLPLLRACLAAASEFGYGAGPCNPGAAILWAQGSAASSSSPICTNEVPG